MSEVHSAKNEKMQNDERCSSPSSERQRDGQPGSSNWHATGGSQHAPKSFTSNKK